jgi:hypothetical protein
VNKPIDQQRVQDEIEAYFAGLLRELENLKWAMSQIGADFAEDEWVVCFESRDPAEQARRSQVLFPFTNAFNCQNELLRRASWIKHGHEPSPPQDMKAIFTMLRQDGAMKSATEKALIALNRSGRNAVTHGYPGTDPRKLRKAILEFDRIQPALRNGLDAWLRKKGYRLLP